MANEKEHGLGWLPDVPKREDYDPMNPKVLPLLQKTKAAYALGAARESVVPTALPPSHSLKNFFSPIENQGAIGSCTANAAVALVEYFERRASGGFIDGSRLFVYKTTRNLLGWTGDTGAYLRTAMEALVLFGAPPERYWPYETSQYDVEPSPFCYAFGQNFRAIKYFRLDPLATPATQVLSSIKSFVAAGFPSMFGFPVYSEYDNTLPGGLVAFPAQGSHYRGGHANVIAGYDDNKMIGADKGALLIRNSWGTGWGDGGWGWLSYRYVTEGLATDFWSLVSLDWVATGKFA
jgi:C1A family cysteine protease